MKPLHPWNVSVKEAIRIQEVLKDKIILKKDFSRFKAIGGGDVAYSKNGNRLFGAIAVLSFPHMEVIDMATADGKIIFPYMPGLLSFREGPILIKTFQRLRIKPDVMIFDGQVWTHPLNSHILPGITRDIIWDLCRDLKIPFREELVSENDLPKAEEMFLSGTSMEVTPVIRVDDWKVGKGAPGPLTSRLQEAYKNMLVKFMRS